MIIGFYDFSMIFIVWEIINVNQLKIFYEGISKNTLILNSVLKPTGVAVLTMVPWRRHISISVTKHSHKHRDPSQ